MSDKRKPAPNPALGRKQLAKALGVGAEGARVSAPANVNAQAQHEQRVRAVGVETPKPTGKAVDTRAPRETSGRDAMASSLGVGAAKRRKKILLGLVVSIGLSAQAPTARAGAGETSVAELLLPPFQAAALAKDAPIADLLPDGTDAVFLLGRTSLWRWQTGQRTLKRLALHQQGDRDDTPLTRLASDGLSLFAATDATVYQILWAQQRVFRFTYHDDGPPQGFFGAGDDFWLVKPRVLLHYDRYGKSLAPKAPAAWLEPADKVVYAPAEKTLFLARKNRLLRVDGVGREDAAPKVILKAKHPLKDLARVGHELIVHTGHTVLRVSDSGKVRQSIPVEGRRKLQAMHVTDAAHAYLFSDRLLEIYRPKNNRIVRARLPLDDAEDVARLVVAGDVALVLADGLPRAFRLNER